MAKEFFADKTTSYYITERNFRRYFSGVDIAEGVLIAGVNPVYFIDARYFYSAKELLKDSVIKPVLYNGQEDIKNYIKQNKIKNLGVDFDNQTVSEYLRLKNLGVKIFDSSSQLALIRAVKTEQELENIKKACEITERAFNATLKTVEEGITEIELKDRLEGFMRIYGAEGVAFETIVAFSKNSAVPHHQTGNTVLEKDTVILIDCGAKYNGYSADFTRTFVFGNPPSGFIENYNAVKTANELAINSASSAITANELDQVARNSLKKVGLEKYFTHSLGHGLGLEIHEYPAISFRNTKPLINGMAFTIEPGVYFDGEYGIRIEDTVVLDNGKAKRLFSDNKELIIIKK